MGWLVLYILGLIISLAIGFMGFAVNWWSEFRRTEEETQDAKRFALMFLFSPFWPLTALVLLVLLIILMINILRGVEDPKFFDPSKLVKK